jgi:hypothetical protein
MNDANQTSSTFADPAVDAWSSLAPQHAVPSPPIAEEPRQHEWRWGWSPWIGIHYGPIPVGLLIAIPLIIAVRL